MHFFKIRNLTLSKLRSKFIGSAQSKLEIAKNTFSTICTSGTAISGFQNPIFTVFEFLDESTEPELHRHGRGNNYPSSMLIDLQGARPGMQIPSSMLIDYAIGARPGNKSRAPCNDPEIEITKILCPLWLTKDLRK